MASAWICASAATKRNVSSFVAAGVPQYSEFASSVMYCPASQPSALKSYGPVTGAIAGSGTWPGCESQPSFQNSAASSSTSMSRSWMAVTSSSVETPTWSATTCAGNGGYEWICQSAYTRS